jgi:hypothetical protein
LFGQMATYDRTDAFTLDDGRSGVILTGTVDVTEVPGAVLSPDRLLPGMDPSALGLYVCLLPVSGLEHRIGITVAIAPQASEVTPLSWLANQMATSIHAVDDPRDYPSDNVLVDPTGTVHPGRYLGASNRG